MAANPNAKTRGWYTVSIDTLRGLGILVVLLVVAGGGWLAFRHVESQNLAREAEALIEENDALLLQASASATATDFEEAQSIHGAAKERFGAEDFRASVANGRRARALLQAIVDPAARASSGEAQFIAVQGGVEFRRGEQGEWETARGRDVLYSGDYVKTSVGGSAEIVFLDGTLYTVRPNTLFLVTRARAAIGPGTEQAIAMEYGWVDLNTAQRGGRVSTPSAEALVARDSEAAVSFDKESETARFSAFRGEVAVTSKDGVTKKVAALEEIRQKGSLLGDPKALPPAPEIYAPSAHLETSLDITRRLILSWQQLPMAGRYALQVSRNRLFVDNLIDVDQRKKNEATVELRSEGTYQWRVAAVSKDGLQGPWSEPRAFRVSGSVRPGEAGDRTPPPIELDQVQVYGNLFIVAGRTEPGAEMRVNGEAVEVAQNGTFTKTLLVEREGWSVLDFESSDRSGNLARMRQRVFVETL